MKEQMRAAERMCLELGMSENVSLKMAPLVVKFLEGAKLGDLTSNPQWAQYIVLVALMVKDSLEVAV